MSVKTYVHIRLYACVFDVYVYVHAFVYVCIWAHVLMYLCIRINSKSVCVGEGSIVITVSSSVCQDLHKARACAVPFACRPLFLYACTHV